MKLYVVGILLVGVAACGGGNDAVDKCDDLVDVTCDRAVACTMQGTHSECVSSINQQISCGSAKSVTSTYDRCMQMLRTDPCSSLFPDTGNGPQLDLPADCNGVILQLTGPDEDQTPDATFGGMRSVMTE